MNKNTHAPFLIRIFLLLAIGFGLAGCGPSNPLNQKISANSAIDYNLWRSNVHGSMTVEQRADFDEAIQELRLRIMAEKVATLTTEVDAALWAKIHQRRICEVMQEGFEFQRSRLNADRVDLLRVHKINASLRTRPGDTASANYLKELRQDELDQLSDLDAKITRAGEKLKIYDPAACAESKGK